MNILCRFFENFGIIKGTGILILALITILFFICYLAVALICSYAIDAYRFSKSKYAKKRIVNV